MNKITYDNYDLEKNIQENNKKYIYIQICKYNLK